MKARTVRRLGALCVVLFFGGAMSACTTVESTANTGRETTPVVADKHEAEALDADPDTLPPPEKHAPVGLMMNKPPTYEITRVPTRPNAIGRLEVPLKREWRHIVVHHSFTRSGNEQIFHNYHKNVRGWLGVGYHFVIGNGHGSPDGAIEVTFRWEKQIHGAHAGVKEYNEHGVGICLVGNFEESYPTEKQMASLVALTNYLQKRCHIPASHVMLHRHVKNTKCPGKHFPFYEFISLLEH